LARGAPARALGRRPLATAAVVARVLATAELRAAALLEFLGRAKARVGVPGVLEPLRGVGVERAALGLEVRAVLATHPGPFVPGEPEPAQAVEDRARRFLGGALGVGVLDAQHEHAAGGARVEVVV